MLFDLRNVFTIAFLTALVLVSSKIFKKASSVISYSLF
jgi:hypothetical protein